MSHKTSLQEEMKAEGINIHHPSLQAPAKKPSKQFRKELDTKVSQRITDTVSLSSQKKQWLFFHIKKFRYTGISITACLVFVVLWTSLQRNNFFPWTTTDTTILVQTNSNEINQQKIPSTRGTSTTTQSETSFLRTKKEDTATKEKTKEQTNIPTSQKQITNNSNLDETTQDKQEKVTENKHTINTQLTQLMQEDQQENTPPMLTTMTEQYKAHNNSMESFADMSAMPESSFWIQTAQATPTPKERTKFTSQLIILAQKEHKKSKQAKKTTPTPVQKPKLLSYTWPQKTTASKEKFTRTIGTQFVE